MPLCLVGFYFYYLVHLQLFWSVSFNLNYLSFTNRQCCQYHWLSDLFFSQWFLGYDEYVYVFGSVLLSFSIIPYFGTWFKRENLVAVFYIVQEASTLIIIFLCKGNFTLKFGTTLSIWKISTEILIGIWRENLDIFGKIEHLHNIRSFYLERWVNSKFTKIFIYFSLRGDLMFYSSSFLICYYWLLVKLLI